MSEKKTNTSSKVFKSSKNNNSQDPSTQPTQILPEDKMPVLTMHELANKKPSENNKFRPKSDFDRNRNFKNKPSNFKSTFEKPKDVILNEIIKSNSLVNDSSKIELKDNLNKKTNVDLDHSIKPDRTLQNLKSNLNNPNYKKKLLKINDIIDKEVKQEIQNNKIVNDVKADIDLQKPLFSKQQKNLDNNKANLNNPNYKKNLIKSNIVVNSIDLKANDLVESNLKESNLDFQNNKIDIVSQDDKDFKNKHEIPNLLNQPVVLQQNNLVEQKKEILLNLDQIYRPPYTLYFEPLLNFIKNKLYVEKNVKIVLGVSGGVDSVVMLDMMANLSLIYPFELHIAHFNHNLRGDEATHDKEYVKKLAEEYNLPFHASTGKVREYSEKNSVSIEEAARDLRYKFFERVVSTEKVEYLATAHTADDSVETFLINLFRGSGLTGLSGIPARRNFIKNIFVIRPLINFKKSDLIKYAKLRELRWREDSSNSESIYTRNKIRNTLIPFLEKEYNPNLVNILNRTSRLIQQADKYVVERVKENIDSVVFSSTENSINLKLPLLQTHNAFIQGEILQLLFEKHFGNTALTNSQIDSIIDLLNANTGTRINIYQNIFALKDREIIVIFKEKVVEKINKKIKTIGEYEFENFKLILSEINKNDIELDDNPLIEYLDYEFMPQFLNIRNWQKGDSFVPFGMNGRVKLSDYFINEKVSTLQKDNICVLDDGLDIIWVIGKRFSEKYKISKDTKKFLKAEVQFK